MPSGEVLEFSGVTKSFGAVSAVTDFSARVEPGVVTGFLGPNGAGKTTTMRILLGLVRASSGAARIGGKHYADLESPLRSVGAALEAASFHPGRTAASHLKIYADAARLPRTRIDETLDAVGLSDVAGRKVGGFSLGMRQRLGLAFALLGDPGVLVLDEPANGLDPEGIIWMRGLLRTLARQGRTVFVSSHLLSEVQQTAERLLIISHGRLVFDGGVEELADPADQSVVVDAPDRAALAAALAAAGWDTEVLRSGLTIRGGDPAEVGRVALEAGVPLSSLHRRGPSLEEVFLDLVNGVRTHVSGSGGPTAAAAAAADASAPAAEEDAGGTGDEAVEETGALEGPEPETPEPEANVPDADADASPEPTEIATEEDFDDMLPSEDPDIEILDMPDEPAEAEAPPSTEPEPEPEPAASPGANEPDHDEPAEHGGFSVASTGIIEIVPPASATDDEGQNR